jgi:hypothetical protein
MEKADKDRLDPWLDSALHQYGSIEPRIGLEARISANLEVARFRSTARRSWVLSFASIAVLCMISVSLWKVAISYRHPTDIPSNGIADAQHERVTRPALPKAPKDDVIKSARHNRQSLRRRAVEAATSPPRLSQFPSPRPLSRQELMLRAYVSQFHEQAVEIALEQAQRQKELHALYSDTLANSDQER